MKMNEKICVIGHKGMLGSALWHELLQEGYTNLIGCDLPDVDLCSQFETRAFFERERPEYVFFCAALAAGIQYKKSHPYEMLLKNGQMVFNVIDCANQTNCKRLINVCSALLYPQNASIPYHEEDARSVSLDNIDTPYALAKAAGLKLSSYLNRQSGNVRFLTVVPCNFFGANAKFEGDRAGVIPALISRMHNAKVDGLNSITIWGTGNACREFLDSRDVASACIFLMNCDDVTFDLVNIGCGREYPIREAAEIVKQVVGFEGDLVYDATKPEGRMHMQLDTTKLFDLGWHPVYSLNVSVEDAYQWYLTSKDNSGR